MSPKGRVRATGDFVVRLVLYAIGVGVALAIARAEWSWLGLDALAGEASDAAARVARWQGRMPVVLLLGTFLTAALGSVSRPLGAFFYWAFVAAIVSAPFFIAKATGGM